MEFAIVGVMMGSAAFFSWAGYYFIYMPKKFKYWVEHSKGRLFLLDIIITVLGTVGFASLSDSLTAAVASVTMGVLGTLTTLTILMTQKCRRVFNKLRI